MNKTEFITALAAKSGLSRKDAEAAVAAYSEVIIEALNQGEKVQMTGFGSFEVKERAAHKGHNPATGEEIDIPASKSPVFKAGKGFRDAIG